MLTLIFNHVLNVFFVQYVQVTRFSQKLRCGTYTYLDEAEAVRSVVEAEVEVGAVFCENMTKEEKENFINSIDLDGLGFDARLELYWDDLVELRETNRSMIVQNGHRLFGIISDIKKYHSLLLERQDLPLEQYNHLVSLSKSDIDNLNRQDSPLERYDHLDSLIDIGFRFGSHIPNPPVTEKKRKRQPLQSVRKACHAVIAGVMEAPPLESNEFSFDPSTIRDIVAV